MTRGVINTARVGVALALGFGLVALPGGLSGADDKDTKPPDWSAYTVVGDVVGEVVKADEKKLTLRVTWFVPKVQNGNGNRNRRPPLNGNNRNFRNPYNRPRNAPRVQWKEQHHDYELEFVPETLVRTKNPPPEFDDAGKKATYTAKEMGELRKPIGVPGYASTPAELAPGSIVEVVLIRDKTVPPAKATENDLRVKYALVLGADPNPPKDRSDPKKDDKKGKD